MEVQTLQSPLDRLVRKGDPRDSWHWHERNPDYVSEFELTGEHVPALMKLACLWSDSDQLDDDEHLWPAPIHAWRALAQLGAVEVVQPLLDMQEKLDADGDQWYLEEFYKVFGLVGPPAMPAVANYLLDRSKTEYSRISAAHGVCQIARCHSACRSRAIELLETQLAKHEPEQYSLNGFLVAYLLDLQAIESSETIERAFAAGAVDEMVAGDWTIVRRALGVEGLGLVPDRPAPPRRPLIGLPFPEGNDFFDAPHERLRGKLKAKKAKAKRKQQEKSRRRNRRAK
jgi:hypothetical protein